MNIIYALTLTKDSNNRECLEISFSEDVTNTWLAKFEEDYQLFNKVKPNETGVSIIDIPLPIHKENEKYILRCDEEILGKIDYNIGSESRKLFQRFLDSVVSRVNIRT